MDKKYTILIKDMGHLQELNNATRFIGCTTQQEHAIKYTYYDAVNLAFNLNKKHNAIDYAVMVEVAR